MTEIMVECLGQRPGSLVKNIRMLLLDVFKSHVPEHVTTVTSKCRCSDRDPLITDS
jgi:hypothetical protein